MQYRIADTFTDSLSKLTGDEQKAVKTTAFDLQLNPSNPGMKFHKLDRARDANFWSIRVSRDIRLIVHKTKSNLLLCYVDHHDAAYRWAERRKLETHPKTGAMQLVEVRETVKEITVPMYVKKEQPVEVKPALFAEVVAEDLLRYGIPEEWLGDVKSATEDTLFEIAKHLPSEAAEALLELATGGTPVVPEPVAADNGFEHPDAQRRFRLMADADELKQALDFPWERWTVFLHPTQRNLVERSYSGPARVAGSAGTGKTVVALHRAAYLADNHRDARVLLTTFSDPLARSLESKLRLLLARKPGVFERVEVISISEVARRLYTKRIAAVNLADEAKIRKLLESAASRQKDCSFSSNFLWGEWNEVVDAWQLSTWEEYRDVQRLGRKTRLPAKKREALWAIFSEVRSELVSKGLLTPPMMFAEVGEQVSRQGRYPYEFAIVDEAQDMGVPELKFLAAIGANRKDGLFFAGDLGQRIFQPPFSWKALGVDIRGRSKTLRVNYRTSHQIRVQADRLLPPKMSDVDGICEERRGTVSAFNGPSPSIRIFDTQDEEVNAGASWVRQCMNEGIPAEAIGVFFRSSNELSRARAIVEAAELNAVELEKALDQQAGKVGLITMHLAKGLEFRAVLVMACDDEILPLQERIDAVADDSDLEEVYNTERHLLYVACTRARDRLLVTGVDPASEFLDDLQLL